MNQTDIINLYRAGKTLREIGAQFGVTRQRIGQIVNSAGLFWDSGGASQRARERAAADAKRRDDRYRKLYGMTYAQFRDAPATMKAEYRQQRANALRRKIEWRLTFAEWVRLWTDSGHYDKRGRGADQFCMARHADSGPYKVGNVKICTLRENYAEGRGTYRWDGKRLVHRA